MKSKLVQRGEATQTDGRLTRYMQAVGKRPGELLCSKILAQAGIDKPPPRVQYAR